MAQLLYRLGRFCFERPKRILVAWLIALVAVMGLGVGLGGTLQNSFVIPGTESQQAIDHLAQVFPQTAGASAQVVVQAPSGAVVTDPSYKNAIEDLSTALGKVDGVDQSISPFSEYAGKAVSDDQRTAFIQVQFSGDVSKVSKDTLNAVKATAPIATDAGLKIAFGGDVFQNVEFGVSITEVLGILVAAIVLFITFGSMLAAGMPLLTAVLGVGITVGSVLIVASSATISSTTPLLSVMLGLAVGIDYALFILSRHRNQLAQGIDPAESAARAVATSGTAVVFAGATVIIALLGLLVVGIPFLSAMGVAAAFGVLMAMLAAITLLPAIMGLAKRRLVPKPNSRAAKRALQQDEGGKPTMGRRWVNGVIRVPWLAAIVVVVGLGALAIPAASMQLSLPTAASDPVGSGRQQAYAMINDGFGPGYNGPLIVMVDVTQTTNVLNDLDAIANQLRGLDGVEYVSSPIPNQTVDTAIIQVVPKTAPDSEATTQLVNRIRALEPSLLEKYDTQISVTGYTAVAIDISSRLSNALLPFALIVVSLSLVLLMLVFRSIFVPLKAAIGFLLSAGSALGVSVAVMQWGWFSDLFQLEHSGPLLSFLPILLLAILFGLAMDYEVFLTSGMREEYVHSGQNAKPRKAVAHGFQHAARVVTAAALIMFFVFFSFFPTGEGPIKSIAFALAVGVLVDAFLVRMTLGPALMAIAGKAAWWLPKWLDRLLPNVDIEGDSLRATQEARRWAKSEQALASAKELRIQYRDATGQLRELGPLSFRVEQDEIGLVTGSSLERRLTLLALGGRFQPSGGDAQLLEYAISVESRHLAHHARVVDLEAEMARADADGTDPWVAARAALRAATDERPLALLVAVPDSGDEELERIAGQIELSRPSGVPLILSGPPRLSNTRFRQAVSLIELNDLEATR